MKDSAMKILKVLASERSHDKHVDLTCLLWDLRKPSFPGSASGYSRLDLKSISQGHSEARTFKKPWQLTTNKNMIRDVGC